MLSKLLREALWAPAAIAVAAFALARVLGVDAWWLLHLAGGAAVAFCYSRLIALAGGRFGTMHAGVRYVLAFALTCSTALAWELAEFALDEAFGSALQEGLVDTMSDLMLSVCGAAAYLAWRALSESKAQAAR